MIKLADILGSTCSNEFQSIYYKHDIKFGKTDTVPNLKSIKLFNPKQEKPSKKEFSLMLLDSKPGIFYYNGKYLIFPYSIVDFIRYNDRKKYQYNIMCVICHLTYNYSKGTTFATAAPFADFLDWDEEKAKKSSAFTRTLISQMKCYADKDWNTLYEFLKSKWHRAKDIGLVS